MIMVQISMKITTRIRNILVFSGMEVHIKRANILMMTNGLIMNGEKLQTEM